MNVQKLTQKSMEALQSAQTLASERSNAQVEQEHLLMALENQQDGLIGSLLEKMGIDRAGFRNALKEQISRLPRVSGNSMDPDKIYISRELDAALNEAEAQAAAMRIIS